VLVPNSINHEEYKSTDENRKVQRKREHSPNSSEKYSEILDLRNPGNQRVNALRRVIGREENSLERECSGGTRVLRVRRENSRRGNSVARITGAGITDAGFASQDASNARSAFKSRREENADADEGSASR